jgi:2,3-bisphosphoglycerate-dependent phosphoglycerate mutase
MLDLILVRHGETDWNRELRFQGHLDVPLNATGRLQAERVAQRLALLPIDRLYVSDLKRAQQTAQPLLQRLGQTSVVDAALREQNFGLLEGLRAEEVKALHRNAWDEWVRAKADYQLPGGESLQQFHNRVARAVYRIVAAHSPKRAGRATQPAQPNQTVVLVTHGGVLDLIYRIAERLPLGGPRQCDIPNAGINHLRVLASTYPEVQPASAEAIDERTEIPAEQTTDTPPVSPAVAIEPATTSTSDKLRLQVVGWADTAHLSDLPVQAVYRQVQQAQGVTPLPL